MSLSYKNQSIDLDCKSMNSFLYDRDLRRDKVKLRQNIYIHRGVFRTQPNIYDENFLRK